MHKVIIAVDNGTTGSIGWVGDCDTGFILTPIFKEQSYTKAKKTISRIDRATLKQEFVGLLSKYSLRPEDVLVVLERPRINPAQFNTSISAARSLESTLCVVEDLGLARMYCDSRNWQSVLLPKGTEGSAELKRASADIGCRLFPQFIDLIKKHGDADGLLIAEWARRARL